MQKINCRKDNICALCRYWLGERPEVNYINGKGEVSNTKAMCSQDGKEHKPAELCRFFEKSITYL